MGDQEAIHVLSMSPYHPHTLNVNQPPRSAWCVVRGVWCVVYPISIPMNGEVVVALRERTHFLPLYTDIITRRP